NGRRRYKTMTLTPHEFIRRFLIHVLPTGFHRIRHYGLLANGNRNTNIAQARKLLDVPEPQDNTDTDTHNDEQPGYVKPCPCCGGAMVIIETFERGPRPRAPPFAGLAA
ncbi:MAG: IS91 family transposase, partial [Planctomycetales bacterium]|nr:IS91 family transposase [Planctomycetales bacterium]NIM09015.1 IS91 family transposase [Planctomycetales bacterium]NIN08478.1 IS91 family transposase [Planctomycetales bacterium]NIN77612.1 IS91 family transposase [Planctomycetales bacterium]NIP04656.1 IS91 family transposase [Planctomycetales bacterium]